MIDSGYPKLRRVTRRCPCYDYNRSLLIAFPINTTISLVARKQIQRSCTERLEEVLEKHAKVYGLKKQA
jgi:hypothetical protein